MTFQIDKNYKVPHVAVPTNTVDKSYGCNKFDNGNQLIQFAESTWNLIYSDCQRWNSMGNNNNCSCAEGRRIYEALIWA